MEAAYIKEFFSGKHQASKRTHYSILLGVRFRHSYPFCALSAPLGFLVLQLAPQALNQEANLVIPLAFADVMLVVRSPGPECQHAWRSRGWEMGWHCTGTDIVALDPNQEVSFFAPEQGHFDYFADKLVLLIIGKSF